MRSATIGIGFQLHREEYDNPVHTVSCQIEAQNMTSRNYESIFSIKETMDRTTDFQNKKIVVQMVTLKVLQLIDHHIEQACERGICQFDGSKIQSSKAQTESKAIDLRCLSKLMVANWRGQCSSFCMIWLILLTFDRHGNLRTTSLLLLWQGNHFKSSFQDIGNKRWQLPQMQLRSPQINFSEVRSPYITLTNKPR